MAADKHEIGMDDEQSSLSDYNPNLHSLASSEGSNDGEKQIELQNVVDFDKANLRAYYLPGLNELRQEEALCDMWLIVETKKFGVHKLVMYGSIPYLRELKDKGMLSKETIQIKGIGTESMEALIEYAYTGKLNFTMENVHKIMMAALHLKMDEVVELGSTYLIDKLHISTMMEIHGFATLTKNKRFMKSVEDYIDSHFVAFAMSDIFKMITFDQLRTILKRDTLLVANEELVVSAAMKWLHTHSEERKQYAAQVLLACRLPLVSSRFLNETISKDYVFRDSIPARDVIVDAKQWHSLPERRQLLKMFKSTPRVCPSIQMNIVILSGMGAFSENTLPQINVFDPRSKEFTEHRPSSMRVRRRFAVSWCGRDIYVIGGMTHRLEESRLNIVETYNVDTHTFTMSKEMKYGRNSLVAANVLQHIFAIGGSDGVAGMDIVEDYDIVKKTWTVIHPMKEKRHEMAAVVLDGKVYVFGGRERQMILDSVECFDPALGRWYDLTRLPEKRCRFGAAMLNNKIYIVGGYDGYKFLRSCRSFDPRSGQWETVSDMNYKRSKVTVASNVDKLYGFGGKDNITEWNNMEIYDPVANMWTTAGLTNFLDPHDIVSCSVPVKIY